MRNVCGGEEAVCPQLMQRLVQVIDLVEKFPIALSAAEIASEQSRAKSILVSVT
jgi:hypothetical protein